MFDELREMNLLIKKKQEKIDELRSNITSITITYGDRVQSSPQDRMANLMCKIIVMENELEAMKEDFSKMQERAKLRIYTLESERMQNLMYMRYVLLMPTSEIARQTGLNHNTVRAFISRGTKKLKTHP